jgi:CHAT domain-containing protein
VKSRFSALVFLAMAGILQAPDRGTAGVEALVRDAENLAYFEAFVPARAKLEIALRKAQRLGDPRLAALCLDRIGLAFDFEGDTVAGVAHHQRALALAREHDDRASVASILASIGLAHWRQSEYAAALAALHEALPIQEELGDSMGRARTLVFIGRVHFKRAEYHEAKQFYSRAVAILHTGGDRRWLSIALEDLGDLALEQGFFVDALDTFEASLAARREIGDRAGEVYMLTVLGRAYLQQAAYREALVWFDHAVELSHRADARPARALALYHMGIAQDGLGHPGRALELYAEALTIKEELGDRRQQAWILGRMGDAHAVQRDYPAALDAHGRAIEIWEAIRDPRGTATGLSKSALIHFERGAYEASIAAFQRAGKLFGASQPAFAASALAGMGKAYAAAGNEVLALEQGRRAVEAARRGPDDVRWATLRSLGWIERRFGDREKALAHLQESLAIIEGLRGRVLASAEVRAGFLERKQSVYSEAIELLIELDRAEAALEVAERSRARAFLDLLAGRDLGITRSEPMGLVTTPSLTMAQTRREARRIDGTIVEYFATDDRLLIWVVAPNGSVRARSSRISRRELTDLVGRVRATLGADPASREASRPLLRRLHQLLIEPVADLLPQDPERLITIVPHGPLFLVSFAALVDGNGRYLVERHALAYSPSITVLQYTGRNHERVADRAAPRLLVIGNPVMPQPAGRLQPLAPLPGAEREAAALGGLHDPARVTALMGSRARESTVRELAPGHTIIHLATHAVIFDDEPMGSYLALASDPGWRTGRPPRDPSGDGLLTVAEVFGLDLHADLVTLSACNTGLGRVSGEGVVGLSRAFIYAGAASVLVSLWRVEDTVATTEMEIFYRSLVGSGGNKAAALATAQRKTIALLREGGIVSPSGRTLTEDPLLWAPFALVGEAR